MIKTIGLGRDYVRGERALTVLHDVSFEVSNGEFVSITGPSGSGKSTLLGLLAGLDRPTRGQVLLEGQDLNQLNETELSRFRGSRIGFVFQNFQLVPTLTALENVSLPIRLQNLQGADEKAAQMLERVGLTDRLNHYPTQLSGGEMQRVAIARASVISPSILFADEPTGNLDSASGDTVIDLLMETRRHCTLVLVTHNPALAGLADREIRLRDGRVEEIVTHRKRAVTKKTAKRSPGSGRRAASISGAKKSAGSAAARNSGSSSTKTGKKSAGPGGDSRKNTRKSNAKKGTRGKASTAVRSIKKSSRKKATR